MQTPTTSGSTMRTARERARAEVRAEILATARRHLAVEGAAALYAYIPDPSINEKNPGCEVFFDNVTVTPNK